MDRDALLLHYQKTREDLLSAIEGLRDTAMLESSLDGWSVKDHLIHVAAWDDLRTGEILRISAGFQAAWPRSITRAQVEDFNALTHDTHAGLSLTQAKWELDTSRQRMIDAIDSAPSRGLDPSLYGHVGIAGVHEAEHADMIKRWRTTKGL
jgi:hypothetical protein